MNSIEIIKTKDKAIGFNYFLDCDKGIMVDISNCLKYKNLLLSEVQFLCSNVTKLEKKDKGYYIGNSKYADTNSTLKYLNNAFDEISNEILKGKTYLCLKHLGKYSDRYKTYEKLLNEINLKKYNIIGIPIEEYINGSWNEKNEENYLTNIMIPINLNI